MCLVPVFGCHLWTVANLREETKHDEAVLRHVRCVVCCVHHFANEADEHSWKDFLDLLKENAVSLLYDCASHQA